MKSSAVSNNNSAKKELTDMKALLKGLKASEHSSQSDVASGKKKSSSEEDETVKLIISRKVSMNENNVIGMNFQKYNEQKPSFEMRRKIVNFV